MNKYLRKFTRLREEAGGGSDGGGGTATETPSTPFGSFYNESGVNREAVEALPEDAKSIRSLIEKYPSEAELYKGIQHLRATASSKGLERLSADADDTEVHRHNTMVKEYFGVPDAVDGYGVQKPENIPDEVWDQEGTDALLGILHKHNASPELVKALAAHQVEGFEAEIAKAPQQEQARIDDVNKQLAEAFGNDLSAISQEGLKGLAALGIQVPESGNISDLKIGYPEILKAGQRMTQLISEDTVSREANRDKAGNTAGSYKEQAMAIKADPANPFNADFNSEDPARQKKAQAEFNRLMNLSDALGGGR